MPLYSGLSNYNVPLDISVVCNMPLLQQYLYFAIQHMCGVYFHMTV